MARPVGAGRMADVYAYFRLVDRGWRSVLFWALQDDRQIARISGKNKRRNVDCIGSGNGLFKSAGASERACGIRCDDQRYNQCRGRAVSRRCDDFAVLSAVASGIG